MPGVAIAALATIITAVTILAALVPGHGGGPLGTAPGPTMGLAHVLAAAAAAALIVGAHGLWRGSRRAAAGIAAALVALGLAGLAEGRVLPSVLAAAGTAALMAGRRSLRLGGDHCGARSPAIVAVTAVAGAWGVAAVALLSTDGAAASLTALGSTSR